MSINLHLPTQGESLRPTITVIGVGGAGGNAVNNMISSGLSGVEFVVANTDAQALDNALTDRTIQLGASLTRGLGAGADPDIGSRAAEEALDEIAGFIQGSNMVFITAGMGGGTGTGAAPVVARMAREQGILTVGVVTKPFQFEGTMRMRLAEQGLRELQQYVDTLIVIPNQNLFRLANEKTTFAEAFRMADEVLHSGVRGVTDLMVKPGLVNLDFADIRTVMREMGKAMMGTGEATGQKRAIEAAESAISNPLLDDVSLKGARAVLINITGGPDMTLFEVDEAANRIREEVDADANIIFGSTFNPELEGLMRVSVVATGIDAANMANLSNANTNKNTETQADKKNDASKRPFSYMPIRGLDANRREMKPNESNQATENTQKSNANLPREEYTAPEAQNNYETQIQAAAQNAASTSAAQNFHNNIPTNFPTEQFFAAEEAPENNYADNSQNSAQQNTPQTPGPLFVNPTPAPAPHNPAPRGYETSYSRNREEKSAPVSSSANNGFGLFNKLAGVGRAISAARAQDEEKGRGSAHAVEVFDRQRVEATENVSNKAMEEDYDIPAFLRRQAN